MTLKGDSTPKAYLVVLGYQQHNLTSVQASVPTMSRISRNLILTICATLGFVLWAGDVSAAFSQAAHWLEGEDRYVWAPAELAVLFGACPDNPMKILKICKAFYGLAHASRKWFDHVASTMEAHGWMRLLFDRCVFVLHTPPGSPEAGRIAGVAGLHVDDFLIVGDLTSERFLEAEKKLKAAYCWGNWQHLEFTFAGCDIKQHSPMSISINQKSYVDKWLEECVIDGQRADKKNFLLTGDEISQLRGIGTLAWKASQTGPQYQADVSLLLFEVKFATIDTLQRANKLVREVKRDAQQSLRFPAWKLRLEDLTVVTWCDASQHNRPDKSSTHGLVTGVAPRALLEGEECEIAIVTWKSSKTPRLPANVLDQMVLRFKELVKAEMWPF